MLSMSIRIFEKNGHWILEVSSPNAQGSSPYFFQKQEFKSAQEAKMFFYEHIGLFVVHMGQI